MEKQYGICYGFADGYTKMEWFASDEFKYWVFLLNNFFTAEGCSKHWELRRVAGTVAFLEEC